MLDGQSYAPNQLTRPCKSSALTFLALASVALCSVPSLMAQCVLPDVGDPEASKWAEAVTAAVIGGDGCYASPSAFQNSDCNIFVGRVLEQMYGINDFRSGPRS